MSLDFLKNHVEALVFCASQPITAEEIRAVLSEMFEAEIPLSDVIEAMVALETKYEGDAYPFQIYVAGGGYQFLTKPAYQASLGIYLKQKSKKRLSTAALETLAIIAYKQPITKHQVEQIRGVSCDYAIQKLLEKELVEISGKSDGVGRPLLYSTHPKFMEYFGINDIRDLPQPKDLIPDVNSIGDPSELADGMSLNEALAEGYLENRSADFGDEQNEKHDEEESES
jgi:segregation and condensation protein B